MATRYRTCLHCTEQFSYTASRGKDRKYCDQRCHDLAVLARKKRTLHERPSCSVEGCVEPANRVGAGLCEKHYMRVRRHGDTNRLDRVKQGNLTHTGGYLLVHAPDHPLRRDSSNRVYEHRIVYYDANGGGPFSCHWCGVTVTWDDMHVDHLNAVVTDNSLSNLVASCAVCNQSRGREKMKRTARAKSHRQYTAHGRTMCISEWSEVLGISRASIEWRLKAGWPTDKVFSPRVGKSGPKSKERQTRAPSYP